MAPPAPDDHAAPWVAWPVGCRVVVRRREPDGYRDLLGELLATGPDGVTVRTRYGDVAVPAAEIALGKRVPPGPPRRMHRRDGPR